MRRKTRSTAARHRWAHHPSCPAMPSRSAFANALRRPSAEPRRWPACASCVIAGWQFTLAVAAYDLIGLPVYPDAGRAVPLTEPHGARIIDVPIRPTGLAQNATRYNGPKWDIRSAR
jgi:hypothetical protein